MLYQKNVKEIPFSSIQTQSNPIQILFGIHHSNSISRKNYDLVNQKYRLTQIEECLINFTYQKSNHRLP